MDLLKIVKAFTKNKLFLLILLANLVVVFYQVINNQFISVHDFTGGGRLFELKQALLDGHFPPRWAQDFGYGRGMPLFQFYAPVFFYVAEIFHFFGMTVVTSIKLTLFIDTVAGFIGMYLLGKKLLNKPAGLIAATAFTLAPYHAVNFYVRGAFAEYSAITLFPWIIYFTILLLEHQLPKKLTLKSIIKDRSLILKYCGLTFFIASLILTHNVTMLTFLPIWGLFTLAVILATKQYRHIIIFAISSIHSILLSAFFLFPALLTKSFTRVEDITGGYSSYELHFLYFRQLFIPNWGYGGSIWGIDDDMSFYLGNDILAIAAIAGIIIAIILFKKRKKILSYTTKHPRYLYYILFAGLALLAILLTNFKSKLLWANVPLVKFIQFPWRFLGVATFFIALLTGYITENKLLKKLWFIPIIVIIALNFRFFTPKELIDPVPMYESNREYIQNNLSYILPDYLPPKINWEHLTPPDQKVEFTQGQVELLKDNTQQITVQTDATKSGILTFNRYTFPNWKFKLDGQPITCQVEDYVYLCDIPSGQHTTSMYWSEQGINMISNIISLIALTGLLGLIVYKPRS